MRNIILLYIAIIMASAAGCSHNGADDAILDRADSLMESLPDSALSLLRTIDSHRIAGGESRARYALLMSQALDKNYIDVTSDSLISVATAYYADRPDSPELMKSLFYQATVFYNAERYDRAAVDATRAYEIASKLNNPFWTGKTSDKIADIFNKTYNYDECIRFRKIAVSSYNEAEKQNFYKWALLELSNDYINSGNIRNAQSIIDSVQHVKVFFQDSAFIDNFIRVSIEYNFTNGEYLKAKYWFDKLKKLNFTELSAIDYGHLGLIESRLGNISQSNLYIDSAYILAQHNNIKDLFAADFAKWEYLKSNGSKNDLINFTEKVIETQNILVEQTLQQSAMSALRDYYNNQTEEAAKREVKMQIYTIYGCVTAILVIIALYIFFRMRIRLKNNAIELKINEVALLSAEIDKRENECHRLESKLADIKEKSIVPEKLKFREEELRQLIDRLLAGRFGTINKILDEYYENADSPTAKTNIFNRVKKEMDDLSSAKSMGEIECLVNDAFDGIMTRFREEFPWVSKEDTSIFMLNAAGLSQKAISLLLGIKLKSLYTKRARLKERIMKSDVTDKQNFVTFLS